MLISISFLFNSDQTQQMAKSSFLNQSIPFCQQQKEQQSLFSPTSTNLSSSLNQPNSSFYMQQFYIKMKMLMQAKPRKGGQIRFNHQQTQQLEDVFNLKKYLIPSERKQIAKKLSLSERQVKTWLVSFRILKLKSVS